MLRQLGSGRSLAAVTSGRIAPTSRRPATRLNAAARLFQSLTESRPQLFTLQFGHSIEVEIGPPDDEIQRAAAALSKVEEDDEDFADLPLRLQTAIIPETTLAALATVDLLEASETDVVGAVLSYGTEVTDAYKTLVRHLADEMISMSLTLPSTGGDDFVIELQSEQAEQYKQALTEVGNLETLKVRAAGKLTMADSNSKQVRLTLDSKTAKPALLRNRRAITADYTARAGKAIRDGNLWDKDVIAEFDLSRDRRGTTAHVRPPTFVLTGARARYS